AMFQLPSQKSSWRLCGFVAHGLEFAAAKEGLAHPNQIAHEAKNSKPPRQYERRVVLFSCMMQFLRDQYVGLSL
ncbi:MAG: hypothetical protein WCC25_19085, partial [Candidatus Korobacteraceae bacterium]